MAGKRFLTQRELEEVLQDVVTEIEDNGNECINAVYIPPDADELTDEETIDDNLVINEEPLEREIAGTFEIDVDIDNDDIYDESDEEPLSVTRMKLLRDKEVRDTVWQKKEYTYVRLPKSQEDISMQHLKDVLEGKSPLEIFFMFFDDELLSMIVDFSLEYARENNRQDFTFSAADLKKFLGILILSGYHVLPQADFYWSKDEDKGVQIIRSCMSRNKFRSIKRNLHLASNAALDRNDKFSKLRPFFDAINTRNKQFGIFAHNLSIDEQMVPYFGRHSCKMFIKGKPVRFGFKLWCLCSSDGYLFSFIPYAGANSEKTKSTLGLGGQTVIDLLSALENPTHHRIFFDNYFSSYKLFEKLHEMQYFATGTIRENRTNKAPLSSVKELVRLLKSESTNIPITEASVGRPAKEPVPDEVRLDKVGHISLIHKNLNSHKNSIFFIPWPEMG
ncbi:hypothetical protein NQ315_008743 [Exocentrus adspersus]|uniref:PiggyBac transposable element-derived protein domain-containing protein n=1 Tax=Exocentrus adspersus TaxID=1586481 RepID=A0AAV8VGL7_9CUCU|nr:hypothetical protein NQ315_008743 [Exocentrus adspersus]